MALVGFYHDAAGLTQVDATHPLVSVQSTAMPDPVRLQVWLIAQDGISFEAISDPGIDPIMVSITDDDAVTGEPVTAVKLALTELGLDVAVAGEPLALGVELVGGLAGAVPIWVELDDQTAVRGTYTDLRLVTSTVIEAA